MNQQEDLKLSDLVAELDGDSGTQRSRSEMREWIDETLKPILDLHRKHQEIRCYGFRSLSEFERHYGTRLGLLIDTPPGYPGWQRQTLTFQFAANSQRARDTRRKLVRELVNAFHGATMRVRDHEITSDFEWPAPRLDGEVRSLKFEVEYIPINDYEDDDDSDQDEELCTYEVPDGVDIDEIDEDAILARLEEQQDVLD